MPTSSWSKEELKKKGDDYLWKIIMKATKNNWPMACGTRNWAPNYLYPSHAYTVLSGMQLKNKDGSEGPKLIKIRNPHGRARYNERGPWGSSSDKWTDSYKKQTGFNTEVDSM
jgi:hypothetical protein